MDFEIFNNMLNDGFEAAIKYKNQFVPDVLYKYIPLFNEKYVNYIEENKKRLDSLKNSKIWLSNYKYLNDPFELKMLIVDRERVGDTEWDVNQIEEYIKLLRENTLISCFNADDNNNMPMWAHYSNNHEGYCIKYAVTNPRSIFPVMYESKRIKSAVITTNIVSEINKAFNNKENNLSNRFKKYYTYLLLSFACKYNIWNYEKEFRLFFIDDNFNNSAGKLVKVSDVGIKIDSIYIGYACKEDYKKQLIEIGKNIGCKVFKMKFDEYGEEFKFFPEQLL